MGRPSPSPTGVPRHAYDVPLFRIRPGASELHFDSWPRIDDALASYRVFRTLRDEGVIPGHVRFQVGLPGPASAIVSAFQTEFNADYPGSSAPTRTS